MGRLLGYGKGGGCTASVFNPLCKRGMRMIQVTSTRELTGKSPQQRLPRCLLQWCGFVARPYEEVCTICCSGDSHDGEASCGAMSFGFLSFLGVLCSCHCVIAGGNGGRLGQEFPLIYLQG